MRETDDEHGDRPVRVHETGLSESWAVPWSDLLMTMFVLFVVLYVYQVAERNVEEAFTNEAQGSTRTETILDQTRTAIRETSIDDVDVELRDDRSVKLSVSGPLMFDLGTAELRPGTRAFLRKVAGILGGNDYEVRVVGHTDSFPVSSERFPTNWELSAARATTVARYLIEKGDLDPGRFTVIGHSMFRPVLPNTSPENKSRNRRVEIIITRDVHLGPRGMESDS